MVWDILDRKVNLMHNGDILLFLRVLTDLSLFYLRLGTGISRTFCSFSWQNGE